MDAVAAQIRTLADRAFKEPAYTLDGLRVQARLAAFFAEPLKPDDGYGVILQRRLLESVLAIGG